MPPPIGDASGSKILVVSKQRYVAILRRRTGKATRRRNCEMKVESDVLIYFHHEELIVSSVPRHQLAVSAEIKI